ncbi:DUF2927 domain-containing protein [Acuticoccus sp.]|uniref:DUF2927 domain-containing protein n=1 Tax=Acuticoccus sp. TaxID=1904378 RepID=UPI003B51FDCF
MRVTVGLIAALIIASVVPATAAEGPVEPGELRRAFFKTVFGLEYGGGHQDAERVKRYSGQVRFAVEDRSGVGRRATAVAFLRSLPSRIAHLDAVVVDRTQDASFRVILVREADFSDVVAHELNADAIAMNARCLVGVSTLSGRIERSTAVIVADDDFLFARCLVEEVLQGLGPMNDDVSLTMSVFNDRSRLAHFTRFDEALMNVLYHPMIRPGMSRHEASLALPWVMHDLGYLH